MALEEMILIVETPGKNKVNDRVPLQKIITQDRFEHSVRDVLLYMCDPEADAKNIIPYTADEKVAAGRLRDFVETADRTGGTFTFKKEGVELQATLDAELNQYMAEGVYEGRFKPPGSDTPVTYNAMHMITSQKITSGL